MKRLLLYVHYNKYDELSGHVLYQLEQLRPLFSKLIVISNSQLTESATLTLKELGIAAALLQKLLVGTLLTDATVLQKDDAVAKAGRSQSVRNEQRGLSLAHLVIF